MYALSRSLKTHFYSRNACLKFIVSLHQGVCFTFVSLMIFLVEGNEERFK